MENYKQKIKRIASENADFELAVKRERAIQNKTALLEEISYLREKIRQYSLKRRYSSIKYCEARIKDIKEELKLTI